MEAIDDLTPEERAFREMLSDESKEGAKRRQRWFRETLQRWNESPAGILAKRQWEQKAKKTRITVEDP